MNFIARIRPYNRPRPSRPMLPAKPTQLRTAAAQQQEAVVAVKNDVTDLKTGLNSAVSTLQETQKAVSEPPTALHFKGITITPGGFLAAEFVRRSRALAADINTPFNSLTMPGASQSSISEFFGSGRQSRLSMLAEGRLKSAKLSGYVETDFLSAATTSNNNESNSYSLRQRQAWGQAAFDNGWSLTGGQMWSLVTETKHGLDNRTEALPMTIDPQYTVGFSWARQYGLRLVKNFGNKVWFGVSVENAQATISTHGNASNFLIGSAGAAGGLYNPTITTCSTSLNSSGAPVTTCTPTTSYSFNPAPDIVAKFAFEPGFGHYEIFGVYSRFRDRIFPCAEASSTFPCGTITAPSTAGAFNSSKDGGGVGANARWSFAKKRLDVGVHGFAGDGEGRYGTSTLADASIKGNGQFDLIRSYQGLGTVEWHGPKLDIYVNGGIEYASRTWDFDPISGQVCWLRLTPFQQLRLLYRDSAREWHRHSSRRTRFLHGRYSFPGRRHGGILGALLQWAEGPDPVGSAILVHQSGYLVRYGWRATRIGRHGLHIVPLLPAVERKRSALVSKTAGA